MSNITFYALIRDSERQPRVSDPRQKLRLKGGVVAGQSSSAGVCVLPSLKMPSWSTRRVMRRVHSQALRMLGLSVKPFCLGVMAGLLILTVLYLKRNWSPSVRQCTFTPRIWKYLAGTLRASEISATKTPFLPQTVPTQFSQYSVAYSSIPTPTAILSWSSTGTSLPSLPLRSKCVSIWKVSIKPNPWILAPFSLYCRQSVPFLTSSNPFPSLMELGARPTKFVKQRIPKEEPPPQAMVDWIAVPAETPMTTTSLLRALFLMSANIGLGVPSSLNQHLAWRDWSPPLKQITSASLRMRQLTLPMQVRRSVLTRQLSTCTLMCLGTIPRLSKKGPVAASSSPSPMQYSSSPQAESGQAEVMTATLGQGVRSQLVSQLGLTGLPTTSMSFWQAGLASLRRTLPKRKTFVGEATTSSTAHNMQIFILQPIHHAIHLKPSVFIFPLALL